MDAPRLPRPLIALSRRHAAQDVVCTYGSPLSFHALQIQAVHCLTVSFLSTPRRCNRPHFLSPVHICFEVCVLVCLCFRPSVCIRVFRLHELRLLAFHCAFLVFFYFPFLRPPFPPPQAAWRSQQIFYLFRSFLYSFSCCSSSSVSVF